MVKVTSDSPGFIEVGEICYECEAFSRILIDKYPMLDFDLLFCFRALYTLIGIRSHVQFYKQYRWLGFDLMMPLDTSSRSSVINSGDTRKSYRPWSQSWKT